MNRTGSHRLLISVNGLGPDCAKLCGGSDTFLDLNGGCASSAGQHNEFIRITNGRQVRETIDHTSLGGGGGNKSADPAARKPLPLASRPHKGPASFPPLLAISAEN